MGKSNSANHIHRYKKVNLATTGDEYLVYKCQKPACSHYVSLVLAEGKLCECNRCHETMIITKLQLTGSGGKPMARPHCGDCIKRKKPEEIDAIASFLHEKDI
jgi:hypothetical protein